MNTGIHEKNHYQYRPTYLHFPVFLIYKTGTIKSAILTWIITEDAVKKKSYLKHFVNRRDIGQSNDMMCYVAELSTTTNNNMASIY